MVKVSIVVTVYNSEKYLKECLESLVNQSLKEIEIICVDDGSTDDSLKILKEYAQIDKRVIVLQQVNQGAGVARNTGMGVAKGQYIIFLDSDDIFEHTMMEKMYLSCLKDDLDVVVCRSDKFDNRTNRKIDCDYTIKNYLLPEKQIFSSRDIEKDFFMCFVWWAWDKLYKKSFIDSIELQFQNLRTTNDLYFAVCSVLMAERISYINDVLAHHRVGNSSSLSVTREKSWDCFYKALIEVRSFMIKNDLYERFERDYINYCLHFSLWHLETMQGYSYCLLYNALRKEWLDDLGINAKEKDYFYDKNLYKMKAYIMANDIEQHFSQKVLNAYLRVKLYYKGYGLKNTVKKICEKIF